MAALDDADIVALDGPMNDFGKKIGRADRREPVALRAREERHRIVENNRIKPVGNLIISEIDDESLPTAVIFRDSFLTHMHGLLAQHFRRLVFVWQANFDRTIIERERPDFILSQQAERFLVQCPDDVNGMTNAQHVAAKMMA